MKKKIWIYDIEIFIGFFSVTFIDRDSDEKREFIIFRHQNDLSALCSFIENECNFLVGYNSTKYDDIIINYLIVNQSKLCIERTIDITQELYNLSQDIIGSQRGGKSIYWNKSLKPYLWSKLYRSIDLMSLMAFDKNRVSLKQVAIAMKWHKIQDLPKPFDSSVESHEVEDIMLYNVNDVLITKELCFKIRSEIAIRQSVGKMYDVNLWSKSRAAMGDKLMIKFWEDETGARYRDFKDGRTKYDSIDLKDCISDMIVFDSPVLKDLLEVIKTTTIDDKTKFKKSIVFGKSKYDVGLGGLHTSNPSMIVEEDDQYKLIDLDFASYYPFLMIMLKLFPAHLSKQFLDLFRTIVLDRIKDKKSGNKVGADAKKIVINSIFGKLNFEHGWLCDPKALYSVTLNGQLFLLMLIEKLEQVGIEMFYANTDGATAKVPIDKEDLFYKVCKDFESFIDIPLEFANYKKCVIRDVNNYSIQTCEGKIKEKGAFVTDIDLSKGYDQPIIAIALKEYFVNDVAIEDTIRNHTDIYDFCKSQKLGKQFKPEFHRLNADKTDLDIIPCQKTNRYYVSNGASKLYKRKDNGQLNDLCAGYNVELFNDYFEGDYNINYNYYISQAQSIIDILEPKQLKLEL